MKRSRTLQMSMLLCATFFMMAQNLLAGLSQSYSTAQRLSTEKKYTEALNVLQEALLEATDEGDDYFAFFLARDIAQCHERANESLVTLVEQNTGGKYDLMSGVKPPALSPKISSMIPRSLWFESMILETEARSLEAVDAYKKLCKAKGQQENLDARRLVNKMIFDKEGDFIFQDSNGNMFPDHTFAADEGLFGIEIRVFPTDLAALASVDEITVSFEGADGDEWVTLSGNILKIGK